MTQEKMNKINAWSKKVDRKKLDIADQLIITGATVKMLEAIEPVYDKYTGSSQKGQHND